MLVLAGSFSYTSRVSFSEEPLLHSPCWFQWAVLGTIVFNHAWIPDVSSSEWHQTIDVVEFHVVRQKSYCTLILVSEKEAKSLQKRGNGKVCPVTARRGLHSELHTRSGLSVVLGMTWRAWACWRAAATDAPRLASSQYRLERLRADMTLSVRFDLTFGHKKLVLFCTFQCANIACPGRTLGRCSSTWHNLTIGSLIGIESLLHAQASFLGKFLLHVPYATCSGRFLLHVPC